MPTCNNLQPPFITNLFVPRSLSEILPTPSLTTRRAAWYRLAISAEDASVLPHAVEMLRAQGRMKYLRPLYRSLFRSKMGKEVAMSTFKECRASYHPIAQKMVGADLGL